MREFQPGERFENLTVVEQSGMLSHGKGRLVPAYLVRCDCGRTKRIRGSNLGKVKTCGCGRSNPKYCADDLGAGLRVQLCIHNAKKRGIPFHLSIDEVLELTSGNCWYCGAEPELRRRVWKSHTAGWEKTVEFKSNGIDRVDNSLGYIVGNCVSCCRECNRMKSTMSRDEFLGWARRIVDHQQAQRRW